MTLERNVTFQDNGEQAVFSVKFWNNLIFRVGGGAKILTPILHYTPKYQLHMDYKSNYKKHQMYSIKAMYSFTI